MAFPSQNLWDSVKELYVCVKELIFVHLYAQYESLFSFKNF